MRGENRSTRGKTSHSRVENQQAQSTFDAECGNGTPGHIGGRQVLSPQRQPCNHSMMVILLLQYPPSSSLCLLNVLFSLCLLYVLFVSSKPTKLLRCDCLVGLLVVFVEYFITDTLFYCCFLSAVL